MPIILTKVIDTICQKKNEIIYMYGQVILSRQYHSTPLSRYNMQNNINHYRMQQMISKIS